MIVFGGLLLLSLLLEGIAEKLKLPGMLLILILGLLFPDFLGDSQPLISLDQVQEISSIGLVVILFYGGITSRWDVMQKVIWPGLRMATLGCLITAGTVTALIYGLSRLNSIAISSQSLLTLQARALWLICPCRCSLGRCSAVRMPRPCWHYCVQLPIKFPDESLP